MEASFMYFGTKLGRKHVYDTGYGILYNFKM